MDLIENRDVFRSHLGSKSPRNVPSIGHCLVSEANATGRNLALLRT